MLLAYPNWRFLPYFTRTIHAADGIRLPWRARKDGRCRREEEVRESASKVLCGAGVIGGHGDIRHYRQGGTLGIFLM